MLLIAVFTSFVEIKADAGQHGNWPVHKPDNSGHFDFLRALAKEITSALAFFTIKNTGLFEFEKNIF